MTAFTTDRKKKKKLQGNFLKAHCSLLSDLYSCAKHIIRSPQSENNTVLTTHAQVEQCTDLRSNSRKCGPAAFRELCPHSSWYFSRLAGGRLGWQRRPEADEQGALDTHRAPTASPRLYQGLVFQEPTTVPRIHDNSHETRWPPDWVAQVPQSQPTRQIRTQLESETQDSRMTNPTAG